MLLAIQHGVSTKASARSPSSRALIRSWSVSIGGRGFVCRRRVVFNLLIKLCLDKFGMVYGSQLRADLDGHHVIMAHDVGRRWVTCR
jgi:hypothetical protein